MIYPDGTRIFSDYDFQGRLNTISDSHDRIIGVYDYDAFGRVAKIKRDGGVTSEYGYDDGGYVVDINHANGNRVLASSHYETDMLGRRISKADGDGVRENYHYDRAGQLIEISRGEDVTESIVFDAVGNRKSLTRSSRNQQNSKTTAYESNENNQYVNVDGDIFKYDANGNLLYDGKQFYHYDSENRLVAVEYLRSGQLGVVRVHFYYDNNGRCALREYYSGDGSGGWIRDERLSRVLTYDIRWNLLAERTTSGVKIGEYVHGNRVDEILRADFVDSLSSESYSAYPLADAMGSVSALVGKDGADFVRYRYDPSGKPDVIESRSKLFADYRFLYTGREWLKGVEISDHRRRYYIPEIGRWATPDPIRFDSQDVNFYRYAFNSPVNFADPSGEAACLVIPAGAVVVGGLIIVGGVVVGVVLLNRVVKVICTAWNASTTCAPVQKCTISGINGDGAFIRCEYTCPDGQTVFGEQGSSNGEMSGCLPEIDDPR